MMWMTGAYSEMKRIALVDPDDVRAHGAPYKWVAVDKQGAELREDVNIPTSTLFSEAQTHHRRRRDVAMMCIIRAPSMSL